MHRIALTAAALLAAAAVTPAAAQDAGGWDLSGNVAITSDYVFRGVSQTEEEAAIQAGADLTNGTVYAGVWASNVSFPGDPDTNAEIDLYGGFKPQVAGWTVDIGAVAYLYTNQPSGADYDYVEAKLGASRSSGAWSYGATVYWSPDFFGAAEDEATYLQADLAYKPAEKWTISGAVGRQWVSSNFDYTTWNAGVGFAFTDHVSLDVRYYDTGEHGFGEIYGARGVATLKAVF